MSKILSPHIDFTIKSVGSKYEAYMSCGSYWDSVLIPNLDKEHIDTVRKALDNFANLDEVKNSSYYLTQAMGYKEGVDADKVIDEAIKGDISLGDTEPLQSDDNGLFARNDDGEYGDR